MPIHESAQPVSPPLELGESPLWLPAEQALYCCDIAGHRLCRLAPDPGANWRDGPLRLQSWAQPSEPVCCVPAAGGGLVLARRDGLWHLPPAKVGAGWDPAGEPLHARQLAAPPYDPACERFNDGRCDSRGRFWIGTLYEPRQPPLAALYCFEDGRLTRQADGITVSNGLAFSPDARTLYWADTTSHTVFAFDFDLATGGLSRRRVFVRFPRRGDAASGASAGVAPYGGRPDGATVDAEGCYWVAMYEGARVLRFSPAGECLDEIGLPVACPTMPCFGGPDLRTLFITTARQGRPQQERASQPDAGCIFALRVPVPGLPPWACALPG